MDPCIIAAIIQGAAGLAGSMLAKRAKKDPASQAEVEKIKDLIKPHYQDIRDGLTVRQVRILKFLRDTDHAPRVLPIRRDVYPELQMDKQEAFRFDDEFKYRLEYLCAVGLVRRMGTSEYALTNMGAAFLAEATERNEYKSVLD